MAMGSRAGDAGMGGGPARLRDLRNLGPASERALQRVGIGTPAELDEVGAAEAFRRLADAGTPHLTRVFLWALAGALLDLDWRELPEAEKQRLSAEVGPVPRSAGPR